MALHNEIGKLGEQLACEYLTNKGYAILETNWRLGRLEADIIAYKEGVIVMVEVKTRTSQSFGEPEEFVTAAKQQACIRLANAYMRTNWRDEEVRFDIISVVISAEQHTINHIENAFSAVDVRRRPHHR